MISSDTHYIPLKNVDIFTDKNEKRRTTVSHWYTPYSNHEHWCQLMNIGIHYLTINTISLVNTVSTDEHCGIQWRTLYPVEQHWNHWWTIWYPLMNTISHRTTLISTDKHCGISNDEHYMPQRSTNIPTDEHSGIQRSTLQYPGDERCGIHW